MSAVGESIVREFFELNGFLVCQHRKYAVMAREKTADEEIDFLVHNPHAEPSAEPPNFILGPGVRLRGASPSTSPGPPLIPRATRRPASGSPALPPA